jgi:hypothetical protein
MFGVNCRICGLSNIGVIVLPLCVRSGHADDAYYLSDKVNQCVVCGHTGEYLRHSIVPHTYRCVRCVLHMCAIGVPFVLLPY